MKKTQLTGGRSLLLATILCAGLASCGVKDNDIQKAINDNPALSGVQASVKDGVVTLSGDAKDDAAKASYEAAVKSIKGVKSVVDNMTVAPPPPPPAPVVINADDPIAKGLMDATKAFEGVKADVKDGVVTLTGEIKRDQLPKLLQTVNSLKPKKVVNQLVIK